MRPGRALLPVLAASLGVWLFAACFETAEPGLQGPGSETVGFTGTALYGPGSPAIGALVFVRPAGFLTATDEGTDRDSLDAGAAVTDSSGRYAFRNLAKGRYAVEIRDAFGRAALVACTVGAGPATAPEAMLRPVGGLSGWVRRPRGSDANVYVRLQGLNRIARVGPGESAFALPGLPPGNLDLTVTSADPLADSVVLSAVTVPSDSVSGLGEVNVDAFSREDYSAWAGSRRIRIRAASAGIDSDAVLRGFPLLVRLDAGNFDFASASPSGSDIRFAGAEGSHLPFEIEAWDASAEQASIWVRLDSLRGGSDTASIRMHWGRGSRRSLSHGAWVFDTSDGFRGVWHLQEEGSAEPRYRDASPWRNHSHPYALPAVRPGPSPLHRGAELDGKQGQIVSSRYQPGPQVFALSLWFRADGPGKLIGFENTRSGRASSAYDRHVWVAPDGLLRFGVFVVDPPIGLPDYMRILSSSASVLDGAWHHVTALQDPAVGQSLYLDGERVGANPLVNHSAVYSGYWHLGYGSVGHWQPDMTEPHFRGAVDEARVSHTLPSDAWIRLSYRNQASGSDLLRFETD